ncbi:CRISPR-associated helicase Cas3' [Christensenella tenuis]|uniref:CRISPR-associated helicase Cas3 n=1 Tax=Christensenella tenuis TaxID=2763033 RepID=A0ABR7EEN2_9FIRM|nr:CRISPR-associated helicase Cas3' [Christensenella tenuis]MBC5648113.1 CRISPR-associated helicase Cas3' [Christensenella tenuis]
MVYGTELARKNSRDKTQSMFEHAKHVADISTAISHCPNTSGLIAYLHDLGKLSDAFQSYIKGGSGERGSVIHAWQGAFLADEIFIDHGAPEALLLKEMMAFCITAHHNRLADGIAPDGTTDYFDKLQNADDAKYSYHEIKNKITDSEKAKLQLLFEKAVCEIRALLDHIQNAYRSPDSAAFALGLAVKYLYSCLVDADRLDAYLFDVNEEFLYSNTDWAPLTEIFERNIASFSSGTDIAKIRKSISDQCKAAADHETGIYQLLVPTGGGKTLSSLRFALHHCKKQKKKRIIYVIPYLSIIEQTAKSIRDILEVEEDSGVIFEHHSNTLEPEDDGASETRKRMASRWDSPIIITTMVQFLESVMSSKSGKLRKFASMADSVIIFDEIQSMPIKAIHCFNEIVSFLSKILNATVLLCSATQPALASTQRSNLLLAAHPRLIDCANEFKHMKRVNIAAEPERDIFSTADFTMDKAGENGNCLVIVNTRNAALELFDTIKNRAVGFEVLHLSTSMCAAHRMEIIRKMRAHLNGGTKVICISTQLIEAGVDISFSCVIRSMAGLDSIAQAAGRCNRNGESAEPKKVYVFPLKGESLDRLPDIRMGQEITQRIIQSKEPGVDLLDEEAMSEFYDQYFNGQDRRMDYPVGQAGSIYAMLSHNKDGKGNYRNRTGRQFSHFITQAFRSADAEFSVLDKNTTSVVARYGGAKKLIDEYRNQPRSVFTREKVQILKKLQRFSVPLYEYELKKLLERHALSPLDEETGILLLDENYYSQDTGAVSDIIQDNLIV